MISALGRFVKSLLFGFLALFRRALCFLNRKRRDSGAILPTHVHNSDTSIPTQVLSNNFEFPTLPEHQGTLPVPSQSDGDLMTPPEEPFAEWDSWDKPPQPQQDGDTRRGSHSSSSKQPVPEPEPEPDYFTDLGLAPTIRKQKKVLAKPTIGASQFEAGRPNRLAFSPDLALPLSAELEEWDDSAAAGGWEDEDVTMEAEQALRQSRRDERERRLAEHQRRNQEKDQKKLTKDSSRLATKLS